MLLYKMSQYFPKLYGRFGRNVKAELDLSNYATYLKGATGDDTSNVAAKFDLASLKAELSKIDVDKLRTVSVDLNKLSNVLNGDVVKKKLYMMN